MREAARALDDVSDHLGEVLRRADELLAEWTRFGAQVRTQVDREAAAIGEVVDGAIDRAASTALDRAITDRLRVLTAELEQLEQRARAASRAVAEQREADRRMQWIVIAGVVLANALLVALLLRKPEPAPVARPGQLEVSPAAQPSAADALPASVGIGGDGPSAGSAGPGAAGAGSSALGSRSEALGAGSNASGAGTNAGGASSNAGGAGSNAGGAGSNAGGAGTNAGGAGINAGGAGSNAGGVKEGSGARGGKAAGAEAGAPRLPAKLGKVPGEATARPPGSPSAVPAKASGGRPHKKLP